KLPKSEESAWGDGYWLLVALGQWAGKDARPAFLRYMRDASLQRKWTMCQVLRETNAEWAIELLSPLLTLTDKLAEDRRGFPVFPNKAEPHLAIRLCDDAARTISLHNPDLRFTMVGQYAD